MSDTDDPAYYIDFSTPGSFESFLKRNGAPLDAEQILTLSTCYGDGSDDRRIIVQAARQSIKSVDELKTMVTTSILTSGG